MSRGQRYRAAYRSGPSCCCQISSTCCSNSEGSRTGSHVFPSQTGSSSGYHPHGSQPILDRSTGESPLPCRYRRVGQPEIAHLSLRQKQGLWEDKKGCVHVREGHGGGEFPCREKRKASLVMTIGSARWIAECVGMCRLYHRSSASLVNHPLGDVNRLSFRVNQPNRSKTLSFD